MADPEKMQAAMTEGGETFAASDTDGDGFLNFAEWKEHAAKSRANGQAKGWYSTEYTEEDLQIAFDIYVRTGGVEGKFSKETLLGCSGQVGAAWKAMEDAAQ